MRRRKFDIHVQDRKDLRKSRMKREQLAMTPEEIDDLLVKTIIEYMVGNGSVTKRDLLSTNVPPAAIEARFKHCLAVAEEREPRLRHMRSQAA